MLAAVKGHYGKIVVDEKERESKRALVVLEWEMAWQN